MIKVKYVEGCLKGHWTTSASSPHFFQKKNEISNPQKHMHVK